MDAAYERAKTAVRSLHLSSTKKGERRMIADFVASDALPRVARLAAAAQVQTSAEREAAEAAADARLPEDAQALRALRRAAERMFPDKRVPLGPWDADMDEQLALDFVGGHSPFDLGDGYTGEVKMNACCSWNGYVTVPPSHWAARARDEHEVADALGDAAVRGALGFANNAITFARGGKVGFDHTHAWDATPRPLLYVKPKRWVVEMIECHALDAVPTQPRYTSLAEVRAECARLKEALMRAPAPAPTQVRASADDVRAMLADRGLLSRVVS